MALLQASIAQSCSYATCYSKAIKSAIHVLKIPRASMPAKSKLIEELQLYGLTNNSTPMVKNPNRPTISNDISNISSSTIPNYKTRTQLCAILEAVVHRVELHRNIGQQRDNWNTLLLNSINMLTLTATTVSAVASTSATPPLALNLSSALLFFAATGMSVVMNKIQPSQLAQEQRNATRLFKQLESEIQTDLSLKKNPARRDVKQAMEKVLALDKAFPLPLLGAMVEKFPDKFEPATWWPRKPSPDSDYQFIQKEPMENEWSVELEIELKEIVEVMRSKDLKEYERLGNWALKINKVLAVLGPLLTGTAALGSGFCSWLPLIAGALAAMVNVVQHGGQVGMVFETYRNCAGMFLQVQDSIEEMLEEREAGKRENGEVVEMEVALKLGRSSGEVRELARKSVISRLLGEEVDEFASKLF